MEINSDSVFMVLSEYLKFIGHWVKEYIELFIFIDYKFIKFFSGRRNEKLENCSISMYNLNFYKYTYVF